MILKNYTKKGEYRSHKDNRSLSLDNEEGVDGYYQEHKLGLIKCDFKVEKLLEIDNQSFDLDVIENVSYNVFGDRRNVELMDSSGEVIASFQYDVFWLDECDILEFAFELPEDIERDIIKFICERINSRKS